MNGFEPKLDQQWKVFSTDGNEAGAGVIFMA